MSVSLRSSSQYKASSISEIRKIVIGFLVLSAFLLLLLSSSPFLLKSNADTLASKLNNNHRDNSILSTHDDMDGDGLSDALEMQLGTLVNDAKGDLDNDGLYDFEEYLDIYGDGDQNNGRMYNYSKSMTHNGTGDVPILDVYHYFNLTSNKADFIRDDIFTEQRADFTNYLLWNVTFPEWLDGGSESGDVLYLNNLIVNCKFSGEESGGSIEGRINYTNNVFLDVQFSALLSGGTDYGETVGSPSVIYMNNTFTNVIFSGSNSGGLRGAGDGDGLLYRLNTFINVNFTGKYAGGTEGGDSFNDSVVYGNNSFTSVIFGGNYAGFSGFNTTTYENNTFDRVQFSGTRNVDLARFTSANNKIVEDGDTYDSDGDGLTDLHELLTLGTNPSNIDSDGDTLSDSYEIEIGLKANDSDSDGDGYKDQWELEYNGSYGLDPKNVATGINESIDLDRDGLNFSLEAKALTDPNDFDTDDDGLNDSYEYFNLTSDPTLFDTDNDGLNDSGELTLGTNPVKRDTDGDGLIDSDEVIHRTNATSADTDDDGLGDGWEVRFRNVEYVDPLEKATSTQLASDTDGDRYSLLQEEEDGTNPGNPDSDGDGLGDGWEALYAFVSTFISLHTRATATEVTYDLDNDGLTLLQESEGFTDPRKNDTDDDGLNDSYEFLISGTDGTLKDTDKDGLNDSYEVLTLGTNATLSDTDGDGLNDSYELLTLMTNATLSDTDGDGLGDGWEVKYNGTSGVNPLLAATPSELASDTDGDGLNLTEEFKANLDPGTADNPMPMKTTSTTASDSSSSETSEITVEGSLTFPVVLAIFTSFSLVFVVYCIRRRML